MPVEVEVLHAQLEAFLDPEPGAIQQHEDEPDLAGHVLQDRADFLAAQHNRHAAWYSRPRNVLDSADVHPEHVSVPGPVSQAAINVGAQLTA